MTSIYVADPQTKKAFSLVELSIVLVILGLLVGGVLTGQSLIRAAELRSVTTEYQRYTAAVNTFKDKYFALPGDMTNATQFWGAAHATPATCRDTDSTSALTCNGDGDGAIETTGGSREIWRFWQHLANAGLIEGSYSGTGYTGGAWYASAGFNIPKGKLSGSGWTVVALLDVTQTGGWYALFFPPSGATNWFNFGAPSATLTNNAILKNEDAFNIDSKMDDGKPGAGNVTTMKTGWTAGCTSSDVPATATYQLTRSTVDCNLLMGF